MLASNIRQRERDGRWNAAGNWRLNLYYSNAAGPGVLDARSVRVRLPKLAKHATPPIEPPSPADALPGPVMPEAPRRQGSPGPRDKSKKISKSAVGDRIVVHGLPSEVVFCVRAAARGEGVIV